MRIGEISMNINTRACNYGSILHSWAFQYYLKTYEKIEAVETLDYVRRDLEKWNRRFPPVEWIKKRKPKRFLRSLLEYPTYSSRRKRVDRFIRANMSISKRRYKASDLMTGELDYDLLVADSDTIWAPRGDGTFDDGYYLNLPAMQGIKKISYAPSMGNANVNESQKEKLRSLLKGIAHISCRETYEKKLLETCTEKKVTKVLDPVLLLEKTDWDKLVDSKPCSENYGDYILVYQPVDESPLLEKCARKYAKEHGKTIVKITILNRKKKGKLAGMTLVNKCAPEQFISLIRNSKAVFTNSFHMICFSLIFEKDFYAFSRKDDKKVKDICEITGLTDRFFIDMDDYVESSVDYNAVKSVLSPQIEESKKWLHDAIFK